MKLAPPSRLTLLLVFLLVLAGVVWPAAHSVQAQAPETEYDEAEAQAIDQMLMCPVCPAETIDQAQVEVSRQMRQTVREMLSQGATRQEILDFFASRYGQDIVAAPPKSGFNLLAWVFPIVGLAGAAAGVFVVLKAMSARSGSQPATSPPVPEEELAPYLEMVDRELARRQRAGDGDESADGADGVNNRGDTPGA